MRERLLIQKNIIETNVSDDVNLISAGIINLERLGLIEISYNTHMLEESSYEYSLQHPFYIEWKEFNENKENKAMLRWVRGNVVLPGRYEQIEIEKGIARLTQFGYDFISACVIEEEFISARTP